MGDQGAFNRHGKSMLVGLLEENRTGANKIRKLGVSANLVARPIHSSSPLSAMSVHRAVVGPWIIGPKTREADSHHETKYRAGIRALVKARSSTVNVGT